MGDHVLRAISDDGAFRVITVQSTEMTRAAIEAQRVTGTVAGLFADLLTGAVLVRETMSPDLRVQAILQGDPKCRMVADAHPDATTRGLVQLPTGKLVFELGAQARLQIARTLHNGALQQGVVAVPVDGGISGALMAYMQSSEQVVSVVSVGNRMEKGEVTAAGGYIVQLLPEVGEGPLMVMTERLNEFAPMSRLLQEGGNAADPRALLSELLYGMPYTDLADDEIRYGCHCSEERVLSGIATLPRSDVKDLYDKGEVLEIACDFCRREYRVRPEQLRGMLGDSN